jgi:carbohydrate kinase (thermoresistant glucokinase family)
MVVVVMGVSGSGKSTLAAALAQALGARFVEGDDWHGPQNRAKMAAGEPLDDADRQGWLEALAGRLAQAVQRGENLVLACSALRRRYRDILRRGAPGLRLVWLDGPPVLIAQRLAARQGHYMPASLLDSQLATLEPPGPGENACRCDLRDAPGELLRQAGAFLQQPPDPPSQEPALTTFTKTILFTDTDGRARFREEPLALDEGTPQSRLSALFASGGYQLRQSPVGFRSQFHCTGAPQWVFILQGQMEIGLQGGVSRVFGPGQHFYSADHLPEGATFDPQVHGHWSRQVGPDPLVTLFVRG